MDNIIPETGVLDLRQDRNPSGIRVPVNEVVHTETGLTHEQARILGQMSYIDFTHLEIDVVGESMTTREALERAQEILEKQINSGSDGPFPPNNGGMSPKDYQEFIRDILANEGGKYSGMLNLRITGHESVRPTQDSPINVSLVMTALEDGDGNTIILSTGTEGAFDEWMTGIPGFLNSVWLSNDSLLLGGRGHEPTRRRVEEFALVHAGNGAVLCLGHSLGYMRSGWAALALLQAGRDDVSVIGINGFGPKASLKPRERTDLNPRSTNLVTRGDPSANAGPSFGTIIVFENVDAMPIYRSSVVSRQMSEKPLAS